MDNTNTRQRFVNALDKSKLTYHQASSITGISHMRLRKWAIRKAQHPKAKTERDIASATLAIEEYTLNRKAVPLPPPDHGKFLHRAYIFMPTDAWVKLERIRGNTPAGEYLAELIAAQ
jgi:hypothetical protein